MIQIVVGDQSVREKQMFFFLIYKIKKLLTENILSECLESFDDCSRFKLQIRITARSFRKFQKQFFTFPEKW